MNRDLSLEEKTNFLNQLQSLLHASSNRFFYHPGASLGSDFGQIQKELRKLALPDSVDHVYANVIEYLNKVDVNRLTDHQKRVFTDIQHQLLSQTFSKGNTI